MENVISKKELLKETGISYGQLYRWKRENLIPEEWFIRKSSYTGQETYFPRDKIIERIKTIQQMKKRYPLEDLARMLSPELAGITFPVNRVISREVMDPETADIFRPKMNKEFCSFWELCVIFTMGLFRSKYFLADTDLERNSQRILDWGAKLRNGNYKVYVVKCDGINMIIIASKEQPLFLDKALQIMGSYDLEEVGTTIKQKLNEIGI